MKKIIKLTERDLTKIVKRVIRETNDDELSYLDNLKNPSGDDLLTVKAQIYKTMDFIDNELSKISNVSDIQSYLKLSEINDKLFTVLNELMQYNQKNR
jgi:hypothetical protein